MSTVEADETDPVPALLIAAAVTVYAVPLTRPLIVHGAAVHAVVDTTVPAPTGVATTRYALIATPPVKPGAVNPIVIA